jgi:hypothetical protein
VSPQFYVTYAFCNELDEEEIDSGECIKCKVVIKKAADETAGILGRSNRNEWFNAECAEVTQGNIVRYRSRIQRRFTRKAREDYNKARRKEERNK